MGHSPHACPELSSCTRLGLSHTLRERTARAQRMRRRRSEAQFDLSLAVWQDLAVMPLIPPTP